MNIPKTDKNPKYFYQLTDFPELAILEENHLTIKKELFQLLEQKEKGFWLETFPSYLGKGSSKKWEVFTFKFFGIKHPQNASICPKTAELVLEKLNLISCDISCLPAKTSINPHRGFSNKIIRAHLGLIVPDECFIRVGDETRQWEEGKLTIFDDSFEHEVWNNSNEDRYVLMFDIPNPYWNQSVEEICKHEIENIRDEFMLSIFNKEQWKEYLDAGEFYDFPPIQ